MGFDSLGRLDQNLRGCHRCSHHNVDHRQGMRAPALSCALFRILNSNSMQTLSRRLPRNWSSPAPRSPPRCVALRNAACLPVGRGAYSRDPIILQVQERNWNADVETIGTKLRETTGSTWSTLSSFLSSATVWAAQWLCCCRWRSLISIGMPFLGSCFTVHSRAHGRTTATAATTAAATATAATRAQPTPIPGKNDNPLPLLG